MAPETQHHRRRRLPGVCACVCVCVSPLAKMLEKASTRKRKNPDLLNSDAPRPEGRVSFAGSVSCTLDELEGGDGLRFPAPVRPVTAKGQEVKHVRGPPRWSASKLCTSSSAMSRTPAPPRSTGSFYSSKLPPVAESFDSLSRKETFLGWSLITVLVMTPSNLGL